MNTRRGWGFVGGGAAVKKAQTASPIATSAAAPNAAACPTTEGHSAQHGPEEGADDRSGHRHSDRLAASIGRRRSDEPRETGGPGERAPEALREACYVEDDDRIARREDHRGDGDHEDPGDRRRPGAEACGGDATRDSSGEGADRVRTCEHAHSRLREVVLVGVVGQQRRQRDEEHRVDEDDPADEEEQTAHAV